MMGSGSGGGKHRKDVSDLEPDAIKPKGIFAL
jgi:hypothetical protein